MEKYSAIIEMHRGNRGDSQKIKYGEEYWKCLHEHVELSEKMRRELEKYPALLELWEKCEWASGAVNACGEEEQYREGFQFGLLMGLEVGMSAMKIKNGE